MRHLLIYLFFVPALIGAQSKSAVELFFAHGLSNEPNSFLKSFNLEDSYSPINVSRIGFGGSLKLGQRTYLRTGLQFSQYGYRWASQALRWGTQHDGDGGFDPSLDPDVPGSLERTQRDHYAEGVVSGGYKLKTSSNWKPFAEVGLGVGAYLTSTSRLAGQNLMIDVDEDLQIGRIDAYHSLAYLARAGVGTDYVFNDHVGLYGMAVYQRHLRTVNNQGTARIYPWQASLELGMRVFVGK